jgi:hypothetical protein
MELEHKEKGNCGSSAETERGGLSLAGSTVHWGNSGSGCAGNRCRVGSHLGGSGSGVGLVTSRSQAGRGLRRGDKAAGAVGHRVGAVANVVGAVGAVSRNGMDHSRGARGASLAGASGDRGSGLLVGDRDGDHGAGGDGARDNGHGRASDDGGHDRGSNDGHNSGGLLIRRAVGASCSTPGHGDELSNMAGDVSGGGILWGRESQCYGGRLGAADIAHRDGGGETRGCSAGGGDSSGSGSLGQCHSSLNGGKSSGANVDIGSGEDGGGSLRQTRGYSIVTAAPTGGRGSLRKSR